MSETQPKPETTAPEASAQASSRPIVTSVESPEPWKRVIRAEVDRAYYDKEYAGRLKKAAKSHQKPGFRKGRTPLAIVEKELGDMVRAETIEALVPKAWMAGLLEHKLQPVTDPELENMDFPEGGALTCELSVEVRPEITLGDLDGMPVKKRDVQVGDKEVDEVLERLQESRATFTKADKAAADGDQILLDLTPGDETGGFPADKIIADQRFVMGAPSNMEAFNTGLVGCKAGDQKDLEVVYPEDHPNPQLKGRTLTFRCDVKEVAQKELPELNDAFAGEVGEGKTLAELRADIQADLTREADRRIAGEMDRQIQVELVRRHDVSLPPSMVEKYLASGLDELHRRNAQTGRPNSAEEDQEYREAGRPHAELALKAMLLMEAVRRQEGIKVEASDVDERIEQIAAENGFPVDRYREFVESGDEKERLEYDLLERRTYDFLLSRAAIETVPADTDVFPEKE